MEKTVNDVPSVSSPVVATPAIKKRPLNNEELSLIYEAYGVKKQPETIKRKRTKWLDSEKRALLQGIGIIKQRHKVESLGTKQHYWEEVAEYVRKVFPRDEPGRTWSSCRGCHDRMLAKLKAGKIDETVYYAEALLESAGKSAIPISQPGPIKENLQQVLSDESLEEENNSAKRPIKPLHVTSVSDVTPTHQLLARIQSLSTGTALHRVVMDSNNLWLILPLFPGIKWGHKAHDTYIQVFWKFSPNDINIEKEVNSAKGINSDSTTVSINEMDATLLNKLWYDTQETVTGSYNLTLKDNVKISSHIKEKNSYSSPNLLFVQFPLWKEETEEKIHWESTDV